jgi:hypothetical protein
MKILTNRFKQQKCKIIYFQNSVETVPAQFELPIGLRLLRVYLEQKEHESLISVANLSREVFNNIDLTRPERVSTF